MTEDRRPAPITIWALFLLALGIANTILFVSFFQASGSPDWRWSVPWGIGQVLVGLGLWRMSRWAVLLQLALTIPPNAEAFLKWDDYWIRYPHLGPFVVVFWLALFAACTLPYWKRMNWRL